MGAPVAGMIVMGIVQTAMALSTISPTLSEQFSALVNLAVVTNVVPYIISLSALVVMMKTAGVSGPTYTRNVVITLIAMLYSTYAIYASGKDAVLGGTIVLALTYIIYGFLAPRFMSGKPAAAAPARGGSATALVALAALVPMLLLLTAAPPASAAGTLERVKASGKLTVGYGADARPFTYKDESGNPAGYAIALCGKIADAMKADLGLSSLAVDYIAVTPDEGLRAIVQGKIDILCEATVPTLKSRKEVSYSIPIFASGIGAVVAKDASTRLKDILSGRTPPTSPTWRANADQLLRQSTISVVAGTRTEQMLADRLSQLQLIPKMVPVDSYAAGIDRMLDGRSNVLFGDRAILLDIVRRQNLSGQLQVLDRFFTHETLAFAVPRDDENLRLDVDAALSRLFRSNEFRDVYGKWFGPLKDETWSLFRLTALPE